MTINIEKDKLKDLLNEVKLMRLQLGHLKQMKQLES